MPDFPNNTVLTLSIYLFYYTALIAICQYCMGSSRLQLHNMIYLS